MKIDIIAGARPNFMKIAPIIHQIQKKKSEGVSIDFRLIHTGQHYDKKMSGTFFEELNIPYPDKNLGAGGGSQAEQTAKIMIEYERVLLEGKPNICLVVGDVTSTMACSVTAKKMNVKVAHVEGGIRSEDWTMPEEINRMVTDSITDFFFTTSDYANQNLLSEGVKSDQIFYVGNTMIDTLLANINHLKKPEVWNSAGLKPSNYVVMTMHRPSNVDERNQLELLLNSITSSLEKIKIVFPAHPRTKKILDKLNIDHSKLHIIEPLGYLEFIYLVKHSFGVITDSGGITEETTVLNIPCITLRNNTERPETVIMGTNRLVGTAPGAIIKAVKDLEAGNWKKGSVPKLWDGNTAARIVDHLLSIYSSGMLDSYKPYINKELMSRI
jgi:UDP-N-acetylglucosamine 2-epimerase (non-hydrolysing)